MRYGFLRSVAMIPLENTVPHDAHLKIRAPHVVPIHSPLGCACPALPDKDAREQKLRLRTQEHRSTQ
jgi:hypothetical protein